MSCLDRKCVLINLDPANQVVDEKLYQINISDLITVEDVMKELNLGYVIKTLGLTHHYFMLLLFY